jgi:hypothetical protein
MLILLVYVDSELSEEHVKLVMQSFVHRKPFHDMCRRFTISLTITCPVHCNHYAKCSVGITIYSDVVLAIETSGFCAV